jgi:hypothetical protein
MTIPEAIAHMEGFYVNGSRAKRNNNPGNVQYGLFAMNHGSKRAEVVEETEIARFAYFPDTTIGFKCLVSLLQSDLYKGTTIAKMVARYAPSTENNSLNYVQVLCKLTGLTPDTVIDNYLVPLWME